MKQQRQPQNISEPDMQALVKRLASEDAQEREQAQQQLRSVTEHYAQATQRIHKLYSKWLAIVFPCLAIVLLLLLLLTKIPMSVSCSSLILLMFAFEVLFWFRLLAAFRRLERQRKNLGSQLTELASVHVIGPLLDTLGGLESDIRPHWSKAPYPDIKKALTRLLPRLQSSDAALLTPQQRTRLWFLLKMDGTSWLHGCVVGTDLMVAILRALEQVGDEQALPTVERLAKSAKNLEVRQAAQACLPFLRQRIEEQRPGQTLLRAASASATPSETLLRPASSMPETEPQQLLRASTVAEEDTPKQIPYETLALVRVSCRVKQRHFGRRLGVGSLLG